MAIFDYQRVEKGDTWKPWGRDRPRQLWGSDGGTLDVRMVDGILGAQKATTLGLRLWRSFHVQWAAVGPIIFSASNESMTNINTRDRNHLPALMFLFLLFPVQINHTILAALGYDSSVGKGPSIIGMTQGARKPPGFGGMNSEAPANPGISCGTINNSTNWPYLYNARI